MVSFRGVTDTQFHPQKKTETQELRTLVQYGESDFEMLIEYPV